MRQLVSSGNVYLLEAAAQYWREEHSSEVDFQHSSSRSLCSVVVRFIQAWLNLEGFVGHGGRFDHLRCYRMLPELPVASLRSLIASASFMITNLALSPCDGCLRNTCTPCLIRTSLLR